MHWGIYHHHTTTDRRGEIAAGRAERSASNAAERLHVLEDQVDSLALICQALWELVRDNTGLSDQDIMAKAQEIDLRDGQVDGKMGRTSRTCAKCERPLHNRHDRCLYCGHQLDNPHVFDR